MGSAQGWRLTRRAAVWSCAVLFFDTLRFLYSTTAVAAFGRASQIRGTSCVAHTRTRAAGTCVECAASGPGEATAQHRTMPEANMRIPLVMLGMDMTVTSVICSPSPSAAAAAVAAKPGSWCAFAGNQIRPWLPIPPLVRRQTPMVHQLLTALWGHAPPRADFVAARLRNKRHPETLPATSRGRWSLHEVVQIHLLGFIKQLLSTALPLFHICYPGPAHLARFLAGCPDRGLPRRPSTHLISLFLPGSPSQPGHIISRPPLLLSPAGLSQSFCPRAPRPAA